MAGGWAFVGTGSGGTTTPGGSDTNIQFNNNGSFKGSALLTTDGSGSLSASTHVSASTYYGDGSNLTGVTASAVQVADGPEYSLQFRFDTPVSGDLSGSSDLLWDTGTKDLLVSGNVRIHEDYEFYGDIEGSVRFPAQNDEGATISKGQVIYIKGVSGQTPTVALAACDDTNKMPAFGLAGADAAQGAAVQIVTFGSLKNLNLATLYGKTFSVGDTVFVETGSGGTSGSLTNVRPKGASNFIQNMGEVVRNGGGGDGQIKITGPGRANATPNLDKGYLFVGDDTNCSTADNTLFISSSANLVGINNTNPDHALSVTGDISASINISGSGLYVTNAYVSSVPADRVLVSTTDGKVTSHSPFTFSSDVLSVPTITASVGIEVTSSTNGSINIGEGVNYNYDGIRRLDIFENEFRLNTTQFYQAMSPVKTSNFDVRNFQVFPVNTHSGVVTGTLPGLTSDDDVGVTFTIKDSEGSGSTNNVVIAASGSQKIDTASQLKIEVNFGAATLTAISGTSDYFWSIISTSPQEIEMALVLENGIWKLQAAGATSTVIWSVDFSAVSDHDFLSTATLSLGGVTFTAENSANASQFEVASGVLKIDPNSLTAHSNNLYNAPVLKGSYSDLMAFAASGAYDVEKTYVMRAILTSAINPAAGGPIVGIRTDSTTNNEDLSMQTSGASYRFSKGAARYQDRDRSLTAVTGTVRNLSVVYGQRSAFSGLAGATDTNEGEPFGGGAIYAGYVDNVTNATGYNWLSPPPSALDLSDASAQAYVGAWYYSGTDFGVFSFQRLELHEVG